MKMVIYMKMAARSKLRMVEARLKKTKKKKNIKRKKSIKN